MNARHLDRTNARALGGLLAVVATALTLAMPATLADHYASRGAAQASVQLATANAADVGPLADRVVVVGRRIS